MLAAIENRFIKERRGNLPLDHREIVGKSVQLMSSSQLAASKYQKNLHPCGRDTERRISGGVA